MTKLGLIQEVSRNTGVSVAVVKTVLDGILSEVQEKLCEGGTVAIRNFGVFRTKVRAPKMGYDFTTGENVELPPRTIPVFEPGLMLSDAVAKQKPSEEMLDDEELEFMLSLMPDEKEVIGYEQQNEG